jgi:hypothetical protein
MLMGPVAATHAQDTAAPAGQTVTRSQTAATGANGTPTGTGTPSGDKAPGKPAAVCFKLTGHCVEGSRSTAAKAGPAAPAKDGSSARRPLNLNAPDVRTVVSAEELKEPLPSDGQITETQESDTVSVKAESDAPDVPGGFGALWWALNHPSQAWRIVAPAE